MEYLFCHTSIPEKIEFQQIKISNQNSFVIADEYMEKKRIHIQIPIYVEWIEKKNQWEITKVDCDNYKNIIN